MEIYYWFKVFVLLVVFFPLVIVQYYEYLNKSMYDIIQFILDPLDDDNCPGKVLESFIVVSISLFVLLVAKLGEISAVDYLSA